MHWKQLHRWVFGAIKGEQRPWARLSEYWMRRFDDGSCGGWGLERPGREGPRGKPCYITVFSSGNGCRRPAEMGVAQAGVFLEDSSSVVIK